MGMMGGCTTGFGWGLVGMVGMLAFWVIVVGLIVYAVRGFGQTGPAPAPPRRATGDRALALLRERFARGEIDEEEYQQRQRALADETPLF